VTRLTTPLSCPEESGGKEKKIKKVSANGVCPEGRQTSNGEKKRKTQLLTRQSPGKKKGTKTATQNTEKHTLLNCGPTSHWGPYAPSRGKGKNQVFSESRRPDIHWALERPVRRLVGGKGGTPSIEMGRWKKKSTGCEKKHRDGGWQEKGDDFSPVERQRTGHTVPRSGGVGRRFRPWTEKKRPGQSTKKK